MRVALIIIGEIRTLPLSRIFEHSDLKDSLSIFFGGYESAIPEYREFDKECRIAACTTDDVKKNLPKNIKLEHFQTKMFQWFHLNNVIQQFGYLLSEYDFVLKIRTDTNIKCNTSDFFDHIKCMMEERKCFHIMTDRVFGAPGRHFVNCFSKFYENIETTDHVTPHKCLAHIKRWFVSESETGKWIRSHGYNVKELPDKIYTPIVRAGFVKKIGDGEKECFKR